MVTLLINFYGKLKGSVTDTKVIIKGVGDR